MGAGFSHHRRDTWLSPGQGVSLPTAALYVRGESQIDLGRGTVSRPYWNRKIKLQKTSLASPCSTFPWTLERTFDSNYPVAYNFRCTWCWGDRCAGSIAPCSVGSENSQSGGILCNEKSSSWSLDRAGKWKQWLQDGWHFPFAEQHVSWDPPRPAQWPTSPDPSTSLVATLLKELQPCTHGMGAARRKRGKGWEKVIAFMDDFLSNLLPWLWLFAPPRGDVPGRIVNAKAELAQQRHRGLQKPF